MADVKVRNVSASILRDRVEIVSTWWSPDGLPGLSVAETRELARQLVKLADRIDGSGQRSPTKDPPPNPEKVREFVDRCLMHIGRAQASLRSVRNDTPSEPDPRQRAPACRALLALALVEKRLIDVLLESRDHAWSDMLSTAVEPCSLALEEISKGCFAEAELLRANIEVVLTALRHRQRWIE